MRFRSQYCEEHLVLQGLLPRVSLAYHTAIPQLALGACGKRLIEGVCGSSGNFTRDMAVDIPSDGNRAMPQLVTHGLERHPGLQQPCGKGMAGIV